MDVRADLSGDAGQAIRARRGQWQGRIQICGGDRKQRGLIGAGRRLGAQSWRRGPFRSGDPGHKYRTGILANAQSHTFVPFERYLGAEVSLRWRAIVHLWLSYIYGYRISAGASGFCAPFCNVTLPLPAPTPHPLSVK